MNNNPKDSRLLVVIDGSDVSIRAARYVGTFIGRRRQFRVCLVHVLPPLPPALREHGGSSNTLEEKRLGMALRAERDRVIAATQKHMQKIWIRPVQHCGRAESPELPFKPCSANPVNPKRRLMRFSKWRMNANAIRLWSAADRSHGFMSCSAGTYPKRFFERARDSVYGPSNDTHRNFANQDAS